MLDTAISPRAPEWHREEITRFWQPGRRLLRALRRYQTLRKQPGLPARLERKYWALSHRVWSILCQSELHLNCAIGGGLVMPHPTGIIVHPRARIGVNCLIFHQVTLAGRVTLGGHVDIGAGAKLIGPLTVGDHAEIGANAVVTHDVPAGAVVAGAPAQIIGWRTVPPGDARAAGNGSVVPHHRSGTHAVASINRGAGAPSSARTQS